MQQQKEWKEIMIQDMLDKWESVDEEDLFEIGLDEANVVCSLCGRLIVTESFTLRKEQTVCQFCEVYGSMLVH